MTTPLHNKGSDHGRVGIGRPTPEPATKRCSNCKGQGMIFDYKLNRLADCEWCDSSGWIETRHGQATPSEAPHD